MPENTQPDVVESVFQDARKNNKKEDKGGISYLTILTVVGGIIGGIGAGYMFVSITKPKNVFKPNPWLKTLAPFAPEDVHINSVNGNTVKVPGAFNTTSLETISKLQLSDLENTAIPRDFVNEFLQLNTKIRPPQNKQEELLMFKKKLNTLENQGLLIEYI